MVFVELMFGGVYARRISGQGQGLPGSGRNDFVRFSTLHPPGEENQFDILISVLLKSSFSRFSREDSTQTSEPVCAVNPQLGARLRRPDPPQASEGVPEYSNSEAGVTK